MKAAAALGMDDLVFHTVKRHPQSSAETLAQKLRHPVGDIERCLERLVRVRFVLATGHPKRFVTRKGCTSQQVAVWSSRPGTPQAGTPRAGSPSPESGRPAGPDPPAAFAQPRPPDPAGAPAAVAAPAPWKAVAAPAPWKAVADPAPSAAVADPAPPRGAFREGELYLPHHHHCQAAAQPGAPRRRNADVPLHLRCLSDLLANLPTALTLGEVHYGLQAQLQQPLPIRYVHFLLFELAKVGQAHCVFPNPREPLWLPGPRPAK